MRCSEPDGSVALWSDNSNYRKQRDSDIQQPRSEQDRQGLHSEGHGHQPTERGVRDFRAVQRAVGIPSAANPSSASNAELEFLL